MVLEKDSSVLGYPGETSRPLAADHHGVCKYNDREDPNYVSVRNVLKSIVSKILASRNATPSVAANRKDSQDLRALLAITEIPSIDYIYFRDQWVAGTNDWILENAVYLEWLHDRLSPIRVLWLNGGAATGKSVMSSFLINELVEKKYVCHYFFIRFGNQRKRSASYVLRALAYQVGMNSPDVMQKIAALADEGINFESATARTVWERIFKDIILSHRQHEPLFWIIDGLDEADDPKAILRLLAEASSPSVPLRILLVSRKTTEISANFQSLPSVIKHSAVPLEGNSSNLLRYIDKELVSRIGNDDFRVSIKQKLLDAAQDNFLVISPYIITVMELTLRQWLRLAVAEINSSHRQTDVERVLQQLPRGMDEFYARMASNVDRIPSQANRAFAVNIIQLVTCSMRVLTVEELAQFLGKENAGVLDLSRTVIDLCGGFVTVDNDENVTLIHQTAREYLLTQHTLIKISIEESNKRLLQGCMQAMAVIGLQGKIARKQSPVLLDYATQAWASHLRCTAPGDPSVLLLVKKFLGSKSVLSWIHALGASGNLRELIHTSKQMSRFAATLVSENTGDLSESTVMLYRGLLESWSLDLLKLVGKFGAELRRNPESVRY